MYGTILGDVIALLASIGLVIEITPIKFNPLSALFKWIGNKANGDLQKDIKQVKDDIKSIKAEQDFDKAMTSRYRIIRASDEILNGEILSDDHLEQLGEDIDIYQLYCDKHPEYKNHKGQKSKKVVLEYEKRVLQGGIKK